MFERIILLPLFIGICLLSLLAGVVLFHWYGEKLFWGFMSAGIFVGVAYLIISTLSPSSSNVRCPRCQQESLVPLQLGAPQGVQCILCRYEEETHSTHYLVPLKDVPR